MASGRWDWKICHFLHVAFVGRNVLCLFAIVLRFCNSCVFCDCSQPVFHQSVMNRSQYIMPVPLLIEHLVSQLHRLCNCCGIVC